MGRKIYFVLVIDDENWGNESEVQLFKGKGFEESLLNHLFALDSVHILSNELELNQCDVERVLELPNFSYLKYFIASEKEQSYRHKVKCQPGFYCRTKTRSGFRFRPSKPKFENNDKLHFINTMKLLKYQSLPSDEFLAHCKQQHIEQSHMRFLIDNIKRRHLPFHCFLKCMSSFYFYC